MRAYYYKIIDKRDEQIIGEGIIRDSEDTIYPQENTGITELPYECEAHKFNYYSSIHYLTGWYIYLTREDVKRLKE